MGKALNVKLNIFHLAFILFVLALANHPSHTLAEGSEQFKPDTTKVAALMILNTHITYGTFAGYSATDTNRLFIYINNTANEKIYFGIGGRSTNNNWYFRVKNPNGAVIFGPTLLPTAASQGFIQYYKQAIVGPNVVSAQGYNGFTITPTAGFSGNYYIEFNAGSGTTESFNTEIGFEKFDLTVVNTSSNTKIPGRIFSHNWSFNTSSYANPFYGSFYIYGSDSSITKVDMNGIKPYKFRVSCNSWGTSNTGNATTDRRSKVGFAVPPQLRLFLRDADQTAYPSGLIQFFSGPITFTRCVKDSICININLTRTSDIIIFIDRDGNGVYNPGTADIKLFYPQTPAGPNCLFWNAKDGLGNYVSPVSVLSVTLSIQNGQVDLPMFDIENNETGYTMSVIRPEAGIFVDSLFYDDQLVGGSTNLIGCAFPCHSWTSNPANSESNSMGNNNTINSWWFAHSSSSLMTVTMPDYLITNAGSNQMKCVIGGNQDTVQLAGSIAYSTSAYNGSKKWTTTGSGTFLPNDSMYNSKYIPSAADIASGSVTFYLGPRFNCWTPVDTVTIALNKIPNVSSSIININCSSQATGGVTLSVTNSTSPYTFNWSNGITTQNLSNLNAGNYTVTVTSANGCTSVATVTLTQPASSVSLSVASSGNVSCYGGLNGAITLTVIGGTSPYSYNWNTGAVTQDLNSLSAGTYLVTVTDASGCTANNTAMISQPAGALSSSITVSSNVLCHGGNAGTIDLSVSGGTFPYNYNWSNGATVEDLSNLVAGSYTATITDANGCFSSVTGIITQPSSALSANTFVSQNVSCYSGANGSVLLTVSGGTTPFTYNWSNGATTQNINNLSSGTYTVNITDANGCTQTTTGIVTQPSGSLSVFASSTQNVSCYAGVNGSIDLTVSGGTSPYTFSWSNGSNTEDIFGLISGTYIVNITDANGCTSSQSGTITQPLGSLSSTVSISQNVSCYSGTNGAINLTVNGGTSPYFFNWSNGASTEDISNLLSGIYTVNITDANRCTNTQGGTIIQPSGALNATANVTQNVSCNSGANGAISLSVNGGTMPYSYNWSNGETTQNINNLTTGTYTVTITDANGCTTNQSNTVAQPTGALSATAAASQNVSCFGGTNGLITITVTGGTTPYSYNWSNGLTTQNLSNLSSGNYTVTITDANGCSTSQVQSITQPSASLTAYSSANQNVSCFGGSNGSVILNVSGGTIPYSYNWSNGAATQNLSSISAGTYTVTITDTNGCTANQTHNISQPSGSLSASSSTNQNVSCFGGTNGSIELIVNGGTTLYSYNWSNGATMQNIANLTSGTYTVTVTDANGCTTTDNAVITQPAGSLSASISLSQGVLCNGGDNGSTNLTVTGGTNPYTYNWSNGTTTQDINNLSAGTYTATITDANGCNASITGIISQPSVSLSANASVTQNVSCYSGSNGTIDLTVNGGTTPYSFTWSNGATTEDISNLAVGTYTVSITDANGCTSSQSGAVSQPSGALSATASTTQNVSCYSGSNGTIDLTVNGGTTPYNYTWSNGATTEDISNLSVGTYIVSIADANGCTSSQSGTVTQPTGALSAMASTAQNVSCYSRANGTIDLTVNGGTSPYTYNWSNGTTTEDLSNLSAGTYTVNITDANGCTFVETGSISQPSGALSASTTVTGNISCFSGNNGSIDLSVSGGTLPYNYIWNTGATTEDISNLSSGTYTVTVTDANGCTQTASGTITQPSASLSASANVSQNVSCYSGANGSINLTVNGGTSPFTFNWSNGATAQNLSGLSSGNYSVTTTDANGCTTNTSASVTQPSASVNATANVTQNVNCMSGTNGTINLTVTGGTSPYTFNWSNASTVEDLNNLSVGTYTVSVTDVNGCTQTASATIAQPANSLSANAAVLQNVSCFGASNGSVNLAITGGMAPYSYNWSNGSTTQNLTNLPQGTYTVTVTDANGCSQSALATVTQPSASMSVNGSGGAANCLGGITAGVSINVNGGTSPFSYLWNTGATIQNLSNQLAGTYTVTVTDANGCTNNGSFVITDQSAFNANASGPSDICMGELAMLIADSITGATYQWYVNGQILTGSNTDIFLTPASGSYTVTVSNSCGTFTTDSIVIKVHTVDNISVSPNVIICPGESTQVNANGGVSYEWTPTEGLSYSNIPNPIASPSVTTHYIVTITDDFGCRATGDVQVGVECDSLVIPSGFSPNGDVINDAFVIKGLENYPGNKIWIYNRWGNLIYKTTDYANKWDGVSNVSGIYIDKKVPAGTYFYVLDLRNNTKPIKGYIVLKY